MAWVFSKRFKEGLHKKKVTVYLPRHVRQRLWMSIQKFDHTIGVQRDPADRWITETTVLDELPSRMKAEVGLEELRAFPDSGDGPPSSSDLNGFILRGTYPPHVFDVLELFYEEIMDTLKPPFQSRFNHIMEESNMRWRMAEGKIFPVDSHYIEEIVLRRSEELLKEARFLGALQEFEKARTDLANADYQGAIQNANLAVESVVKGITDIERAKPGELYRQLIDSGLVPEYYRGFLQSFEKNILRCVAIMRNEELGAGHGQGPQVHEIPSELAELAVNLSGVLINYLVKRHIATSGPSEQADAEIPEEDKIPF